MSWVGEAIERENRLVGARGWEEGKQGGGGDCFMDVGFRFGVTEMFWNWMVVMEAAQHGECTK